MKLMKICLALLTTISIVSIYSVNALSDEFEYELLDNGTIEIQGYDGEDTSITVPAKIEGVSVKSIGDDAFSYYDTLTNITISNGIKIIGSSAFSDCTSLESISIPKSVTSIGDFAFYRCESLTSIKIPEKIKIISEYMFSECSSLKSVTIPNSVTSIEEGAFDCCSSLTTITIPNTVTKLGDYAFNGCTDLKEITIPSSVTSIGESAFDSCETLTDVTILGNIKNIPDYTFSDCTRLKNITIPDSVTNIGDSAFENCSHLTSMTIPKNITNIGESVFGGCERLTDVTILGNIKSISDYTFSDCIRLKNITIPDSVTSIGEGAFEGCASLTSIIIPKSVTSMGEDVFYDCPQLTLKVYPNSYALKYAKENSIPYEIITTSASAVQLDKTSLSLYIGESKTLIATITPSDVTDKTLIWTSSDPGIVKVDSKGQITALSKGQAIVTVRTSSGKEAQCSITVIESIVNTPITSISLNQTTLTLSKGNMYTLIGIISPSDTTDNKVLSWSSSNTDIVQVDENGNVTAISEGQAIITVKTSNGKEAQCFITVIDPIVNIPITSISLNQTILTLDKGDTYTLIGTVYPNDTTDSQLLSWSSSDSSIVEVDSNGKITALSKGQVIITAKTSNGLMTTCTVTVKDTLINISHDEESNKPHSLIYKEKTSVLNNVKTEDKTNIIVWLELIMGSLIILVFVNITKNKKMNRN